jgi:RimJ/RimL family protein N-acetyltransferase
MIKLRKLNINDSIPMLEFINDFETQRNTNFLKYSNTKEDFQKFIKNSMISKKHIHFAIDFKGSYAGTVSLKNLNYKGKKAEFAIVVLPKYRGFGIGSKALQLIENHGKSIGINIIYLNVFVDNKRAISIYQKAGFFEYFTTYRKNEFQNKLMKLIWMKKII